MIKWPAPNVVCYDVTDKVLFKTLTMLASLWYMIEDIFLLIKIGPSVSRWNKSRESGQLIGKNNHNQTTSRREEIAASSKDKGRWMWPVDGPWNRKEKKELLVVVVVVPHTKNPVGSAMEETGRPFFSQRIIDTHHQIRRYLDRLGRPP